MPEHHLEQPTFTYCACGPFTKNKERMQKLGNARNVAFTMYLSK